MGLILECHALPADADTGADPRSGDHLLRSVSINSGAAENLLAPLVDGPLAGLNLAADEPAGLRFGLNELTGLKAKVCAAGIDPDLANTLADAIDDALARQSGLWIGWA